MRVRHAGALARGIGEPPLEREPRLRRRNAGAETESRHDGCRLVRLRLLDGEKWRLLHDRHHGSDSVLILESSVAHDRRRRRGSSG